MVIYLLYLLLLSGKLFAIVLCAFIFLLSYIIVSSCAQFCYLNSVL